MPDLKQSLGHRYLCETKFSRTTIRGQERPRIGPAPAFKEYPGARRIALPKNPARPAADLWRLLQERRSERRFSGQSMTFDELALLLWASQGVTAAAGSFFLRTAPSAGALYPIETYLAVERVDGLGPGLFHFHVKEFALEQLSDQAIGKLVARAALDQSFVAEAAVIFLWSAIPRRNMAKYGHRGFRYICLDAGHICQNLLLAAAALGRKGCPVAALYDDELNGLLGLDGMEESVLYLAPIG